MKKYIMIESGHETCVAFSYKGEIVINGDPQEAADLFWKYITKEKLVELFTAIKENQEQS